jgi:formate dehydrogenase alpha subunit
LIKRDGKFVEAGWDEALDRVAQKFKELKKQYGPEGLGVISSSRATNETNYLAQKFARAVFQTSKVDNCARICHAPSVHGLLRSFGSGSMTNSFREIEEADCILLIGSNTTEAHPVAGTRIRKAVRKGAKLIVVDPREIELAKIADIHLALRPGTDIALVNAMAHHIISHGLHDQAFIDERTEGFEEFWAVVKEYTPEYTEEITGVPASEIREAAELYARAEPGMVIYCLGITEHTVGVVSVQAVANLALITGHVGKLSSGVNPIRGQNNVQGACDMGALPEFLPGYQKWENPEHVSKFEKAWGVELPKTPGYYPLIFCSRMWDDILKGNLHGLYIIGEDVAMTEANISKVRKALESLDFLVVQELFMTPTAELAHVVLPAAGFAEIDGTFTDSERRVQRLHAAISPPGEAKPDWQITCEISKRMGYRMDYESSEAVFDELRRLIPSYSGITYKRLDENPGLQWPCPTEDHPGTQFLHKDKFSRGKGKLAGIEQKPPEEVPDDEYPFLLTTGRVLHHYNCASMTREVSGLEQIIPENFIELSAADAARLEIAESDRVRVVSRRGKVLARTRIREIPEGVVWMPFHHKESPTNLLTNDALDPISGTAELKACAVRIERALTA